MIDNWLVKRRCDREIVEEGLYGHAVPERRHEAAKRSTAGCLIQNSVGYICGYVRDETDPSAANGLTLDSGVETRGLEPLTPALQRFLDCPWSSRSRPDLQRSGASARHWP